MMPQQSVSAQHRESLNRAFGRAFFPCPASDIGVDGSEGSETISGLTSSTHDELPQAGTATAAEAGRELDGIPPIMHSYTDLPAPGDIYELDTLPRINSLPDLRTLEDMEVATSTCTGEPSDIMGSASSSSSSSQKKKAGKTRSSKRIAQRKKLASLDEQKENSNSAGSSESAKSDISVPSDCG
jgi:hypothetical protein